MAPSAVVGLLLAFGAVVVTGAPLASSDAPFSVPTSQLASAVICPRGIQGAAGGIVFLIPGTGSTGSVEFPGTPYNVLLPTAGPGFDICWLDVPGSSSGDAQITAEYVAYNIPILAAKSATKKIGIVGHSQGAGLNPQWALDFWPSTRQHVSDYVAIAGDFHGTIEGPLSCAVSDITDGGCAPAVLQQSTGSKYLAAQNKRGGSALVTTTSIYTRYDDIIQDEIIHPTSVLPGATNIALQDLDICGPLHIADHFTIIVDPAAYFLVLDALTHDGPASPARFDSKYCNFFKDQVLLDFKNAALVLRALVLDILPAPNDGVQPLLVEPPLKKYVCDQGQATECGST